MENYQQSFIRQMPKVELHAHLSGSLSIQTVRELINLHKQSYPKEQIPSNVVDSFAIADGIGKLETEGAGKGFDAAYDIFFAAQFLIDHVNAVELATRRVLEEFAADNVVYLELRTTPRHVDGRMQPAEHITKVLEVIDIMVSERKLMQGCKLLLSIDRRKSLEEAEATLALYLSLRNNSRHGHLLAGIDFSGDARSNDAITFIPLLKKAKDNGIKLAVHIAEVPNEKETAAFLGATAQDLGMAACELYLPLRAACGGRLLQNTLEPDRIGHGTYIHPAVGGSQRIWDLLIDSEIPVEICLTSNVCCKTAKNYSDHHVRYLQAANHPYVICTDDKGVFNTTLSEEWMHLSKSLQFTVEDICKLNLDSVKYLFTDDDQKQEVYNLMVSWYYGFVGYEDAVASIDKTCKFRAFDNNINAKKDNSIQELCNKVRGDICDWHNKNDAK